MIFVFGSNLAGRHGKGAARIAFVEYGAKYGIGSGRTGDAYAIPTKDEHLRVLTLHHIGNYVHDFVKYAKAHPELGFQVTRVGCGLAGYSDEQIAPLFKGVPINCAMPSGWRAIIRLHAHRGA